MTLYKFHAIFPSGDPLDLFAPTIPNMMALIGFIFRESIANDIHHVIKSLDGLQIGDVVELPPVLFQDCYITRIDTEA